MADEKLTAEERTYLRDALARCMVDAGGEPYEGMLAQWEQVERIALEAAARARAEGAADEREACARQTQILADIHTHPSANTPYEALTQAADAIRARGETK